MAELYLILCTCDFFIHSSVCGHFSGLHDLAIVHSAVVCVWVRFSESGLLRTYSRVWSPDDRVAVFLPSKGTIIVYSLVAVSIRGSPFLNSVVAIIVCRLLDYDHFDWCDGIPYWTSDLHVSNKSSYCAYFWVLFFFLTLSWTSLLKLSSWKCALCLILFACLCVCVCGLVA